MGNQRDLTKGKKGDAGVDLPNKKLKSKKKMGKGIKKLPKVYALILVMKK